MLIQNYGLFWKEEDVYWGKPKSVGHLQGLLATNVTATPVDFREQQGVYVLYDEGYRIVYVGQAGANDKQNLFGRLKQHKRDDLAGRWSKFSWFGIRWVKHNGQLSAKKDAANPKIGDVLNHVEAILISAAEPPRNKQGGRFGDEVEQYLQFRDEVALGPTLSEMVKQIFEKC